MTNEELERKLREQEESLGGEWAGAVAERARAVSTMRPAGKARVCVVGGQGVVRVTLTASTGPKPRSYTVTHGMGIQDQMMGFLLQDLDQDAPLGARVAASSALREAMSGFFETTGKAVDELARELLADKERVSEVRDAIRAQAAKKMKKEKDDLVSSMCALLSSGWTREKLVEAMEEAVVRNVMTA